MADEIMQKIAVDASVRVSYCVRYRLATGEDREVRVDEKGIAWPASLASELGLITVRGDEVRRLRVCPTVPLTVLSCEAELGCNLAGAKALFLNGYNSWTDSWERPVDARMRGLGRAPKRMVERYVLDGSGDYRFTPEDGRPGHQHGFGYGYLRYDEDVLLFASLDESNGYTTLFEDLDQELIRLQKEPPARELAVDENVELMSFALMVGALDEVVPRWLERAGIAARPAAPLVGFSSWYRHYGDISQEKLERDFEAVRDLLASCELGPCQPIFQIDDGYAKVGDWMAPDEARFPQGMASFATRIAEAGLMPGLWMAPFVCETDSETYRQHQDWLLRDDDGSVVVAGSNWSGYYPLDTRNPAVRTYIHDALWTATHEWGYKMLKLDFLFAACMVPHDGLNRGQLMADALDLLRASVPADVSFDLCGVPIAAALGKTEYCRIGPDVGLDWDDRPHMRILHRERVSTKNSLHNTQGRAHLDGRAFRNDPDVFFLRTDVKLTKRQRAHLLGADAALGGMFLTSDDVGAWSRNQRLAFQRALAVFVDKERARTGKDE